MSLKTKSSMVQVPVVPVYIASWYEENKDDIDFAIWEACRDYEDSPVGKWIEETDGAIPTLVKMGIVGYECENDGYVVKDSEGRYVKESFISIAYGIVSKCNYEYTLDPRSADVFLDESMAQIMAKLLPDKAEVLALKELREERYYEV